MDPNRPNKDCKSIRELTPGTEGTLATKRVALSDAKCSLTKKNVSSPGGSVNRTGRYPFISGAAEFLFFGMLLLLETSEKECSTVERQELSDARADQILCARAIFFGWRQLKSHNLLIINTRVRYRI